MVDDLPSYIFSFGFADKPSSYSSSKAVIIPASFRTSDIDWNTKGGPESIISASKDLELYDFSLSFNPHKIGIFTSNEICGGEISSQEVLQQIENRVKKVLSDNKFPIILGSNHIVTVAGIKGAMSFCSDLGLIYMSGKADLYDFGGQVSPRRESLGRFLMKSLKVIFIGVRTLSSEEDLFLKVCPDPPPLCTAEEIWNGRFAIESLLKDLPERIYISLDFDIFDPSQVLAYGNLEPGGLLFNHVATILSSFFQEREVIACDLVEYSSDYRFPHGALLGAKILYRICGLKLKRLESLDSG